jgi:hypothetical protein
MNALLFVQDLTGFIVVCAAIIALLTQVQIIQKTRTIFGVGNPVLLKWHRWAGRIALGGFVSSRIISSSLDWSPALLFRPQRLTHSVLSVLCAVAVLSKIWIKQREMEWEINRVLPWWATALIVGTSFVILACMLATWHWTNPTATWDRTEYSIYRVTILGHITLAVTLIWLGRLVLKNLPS